MKTKDGVHSYKIALKSVKTEEFAFFESNYKNDVEIGLTTQIQFKIDTTTQMLGSYFSFEFDQNKIKFLKIVVSCHFYIDNKSWSIITTTKNSKVTIPKSVISNYAEFGISTTRGVLAAKTEGQKYPQFIIPFLDIKAFIKNDAIFNIGEEPTEKLI